MISKMLLRIECMRVLPALLYSVLLVCLSTVLSCPSNCWDSAHHRRRCHHSCRMAVGLQYWDRTARVGWRSQMAGMGSLDQAERTSTGMEKGQSQRPQPQAAAPVSLYL